MRIIVVHNTAQVDDNDTLTCLMVNKTPRIVLIKETCINIDLI